MKILVTGGAGFIGSNIAKKLVQKGHAVTVFDNLATGYLENLEALDVEFINGDMRDTVAVSDACCNKDVVFHLAACVGNIKSIENPLFDIENNYIGALNLCTAVKERSVQKIVYSSSSAGYGEPRYLPVDENHPLGPDSPYGVSKIAAEKLIHAYAKLYDFKAVSLRYFNAYGINQRYDAYGNVIPVFFNRLLNSLPILIFGDGTQTRDFVNVEDIAAANLLALDYQDSNIFNIASGESITLVRLVEAISKATGKSIDPVFMDARKGEVKHSAANIEAAKLHLDFRPMTMIDEGLAAYSEWFFKEFHTVSA